MVKNRLELDGNKLLHHLPELNKWKNGEIIYPILVEISPVGYCNQRCIFCAYEYLTREKTILERKRTLEFLNELAEVGTKSVFFSGEGEPLLHPNLIEFIQVSKKNGLDCALNTNGTLLTEKVSEQILKDLSWIRFSVNAGSRKSYQRIHNAKEDTFDNLLKNFKDAVILKRKNNLDVVLGVQLVYIGQGFHEIKDFAKKLKDIGMDYFTIKMFNKHPSIDFQPDGEILTYQDLVKIEELSSDGFYVTARKHFVQNIREREYRHCYGLDFFAELQSNGDFCPCGPLLGMKEYNYGNIYQQSFKDIWQGELRREVLERIKNKIDVNGCMDNCRLNSVNNLLWKIKNKPMHVNFI